MFFGHIKSTKSKCSACNIAFFILFLTATAFVHAELPIYKCKNGNIQSIPCFNTLANSHSKASISKQALNQYNNALRVSNVTFTRVSQAQGRWDGNILGKGKGSLIFRIYKNKKLLRSSKINQFEIKNSKKLTNFRFYHEIPQEQDWHWSIELE